MRRPTTLWLLALAAAAPATLRRAAHGTFRVGTAVVANTLPHSSVADLLAEQFDAVTPEYECEPDSLEPQPGHFDFGPVDRIADFAAAHHVRTVGHALVWGQMTPGWMWADAAARPLSRPAIWIGQTEHLKRVENGWTDPYRDGCPPAVLAAQAKRYGPVRPPQGRRRAGQPLGRPRRPVVAGPLPRAEPPE